MNEPSLTSQLLGVAIVLAMIFVFMVLVAAQEEREQTRERKQKEHDELIKNVYLKGLSQFNNIARENLKKCDRSFTYDTQRPEGLRPELLALPAPK
ncbi:hypothetical protein [Streptococcus oralis]|uniref:hypothetical protein n=1 Tax=Streptococcus oralis TaxID=1303 RepID=UPI001BD5B707|nr:hypothetical protein [Streptococcus oralis]MBS9401948.1 hypothetical protein [Streptococcus oralis]